MLTNYKMTKVDIIIINSCYDRAINLHTRFQAARSGITFLSLILTVLLMGVLIRFVPYFNGLFVVDAFGLAEENLNWNILEGFAFLIFCIVIGMSPIFYFFPKINAAQEKQNKKDFKRILFNIDPVLYAKVLGDIPVHDD